jgi:hypothetical protein
MKPASRLTFIFLLLVMAAHLARFILGLEVTIGGASIPNWASGLAAIIVGALAFAFRREQRE